MAQPETQMDPLSGRIVKISKQELPLSCPRDANQAGMHPRVYIPLKNVGDEASCPYCRTRYRLVD